MNSDPRSSAWAVPIPQAHYINDPDHWQQRAKEMRRMADQVADLSAKASMMKIAEEYDRLAERAAKRAGSK